METSVDGADLIRVILQFCRENGLTQTHATLQAESQVSLNAVESVQAFKSDILAGRWELVLPAVSLLVLPPEKLADLYAQLVLELIEARDTSTASGLLRESEPLAWLRTQSPAAVEALEALVRKPYFDPREAYPEGTSKEGRRAAIAQQLADEVVEAPPSRLVSLVGQALKWQRFSGSLPPGDRFDLFRDAAPRRKREEETPPSRLHKEIKFGAKSHAEAGFFTADGFSLVTGSTDGFVEVWDPASGRLRKDLPFQASDAFMMHDQAVLAMAMSADGEFLATGSKDGMVKVWRMASGQCVRRLPKAHDQGVTCLAFSRDGTHVLTGSLDATARLHGLKSAKTLREYRGHTACVNAALFTTDAGRVVTASSDGTVRVWDARSAECAATFQPPQATLTHSAAVSAIALSPRDADQVVICNKSTCLYVMTLSGKLVRTIDPGKLNSDFLGCAVSPKGRFLYCISEDGQLHAIGWDSGSVERSLQVCDKDPLGVAVHPYQNLVATWSSDRRVCLWTA